MRLLQSCRCYTQETGFNEVSKVKIFVDWRRSGFSSQPHPSGPNSDQAYVDSRNMHLFKWSWSWPRRCSSSPYVISLAELSSSFSCWNCADSSVKSVGFLQAHLSQQRSGEPTQHTRFTSSHVGQNNVSAEQQWHTHTHKNSLSGNN